MKEAEYFRQASLDVDFRREKILEQREQKKFARGFLIFGAIVMTVLVVISGITEGKWLAGLSYFGPVIVAAMMYSTASTRLAALEAMEGRAPTATDRPIGGSIT
jgi:hypothetical protein